MNREFEQDMQRVLEGSLSRDDAAEVHGAGNVGEALSLHDRLSQLASVEVEVAPWYLVAPRLAAEPTRRRGRRVAVVSLVAGLILVPAVAEGIEAVAPEAVRDTVIDKITDVLPWDRDSPAVDKAPERPQSDQPSETGVPATTDRRGETDAPADDPRPDSDSGESDRERRQDSERPEAGPTTDAPGQDQPSDGERGEARNEDVKSDESGRRDRPADRRGAVRTDSPTTSTARTDRPDETTVPTEHPALAEPVQPAESEGSSLPGGVPADRSDRGSDLTTTTTAEVRDH